MHERRSISTAEAVIKDSVVGCKQGAVNISGLCLYFQRREVKGLKFHHQRSCTKLGMPDLPSLISCGL